MRILGPPSANYPTVLKNAEPVSDTPWRVSLFPLMWDEALRYGIDPVGVIAQSIKETGGGTYQGKVKLKFYNPCGLKVRHQDLFPELAGDQPLAHAMFPNWQTGCRAHVQHIRAYTGWPVPDTELIVDPRYTYVTQHRCENWSDLGGKWAPSPTYGTEIESLMRRLQGVTL